MKRATTPRLLFLAGVIFVATLSMQLAFGQSASAPATASTGILKGRVPVIARKAAAPPKDYGAKPSIKIEAPDPAVSAVWVGSGAPALDPKTASVARIIQRGFQFRPAVTVVQAGTPVVFPNEDQMYHSVFSISAVKRFDLGRYRKGEEPDAVVFDKPGLVKLFCEVHNHMRASLIVVDTPWFTSTEPDGSFQIAGIAPGKYTATIWLSPDKQVERSIEISSGKTLEVDWSSLDGMPAP